MIRSRSALLAAAKQEGASAGVSLVEVLRERAKALQRGESHRAWTLGLEVGRRLTRAQKGEAGYDRDGGDRTVGTSGVVGGAGCVAPRREESGVVAGGAGGPVVSEVLAGRAGAGVAGGAA